MLTDVQRIALLDELQVTRSLWPQMPEGEHALRGYGEHLDVFTPDEIHAGFRLARLRAEHTYPKVAQVYEACSSVVKDHRTFRLRPEGDNRLTPCCDGYLVVETWRLLQTRFTLGNNVGKTVDRFGISHTSECHRPKAGPEHPSPMYAIAWRYP